MPRATRERKPPVGSGTRPSSMAAWVTVAPMVTASLSSLDGGQLGDARDVDEEGRLREAQVEHGAERLAAGEHLGAGRALERAQGLGDGGGADVVEGGGLHAAAASARGRARAIASTMRRGVMGDTSSSAPRSVSASLMALAMAAGGAMAPPSPIPFWPKRV